VVKSTSAYRFGTFELDRGKAELRKRGLRIKLQEQPFRILCVLLDHAGEVVSREALCEALWPNHTFVEFERSLNAAVAKLRLALMDSADNPRYVETVARRGYKFIAPVEAIVPAEGESAGTRPSQGKHGRSWVLASTVAAVLVAAGVMFAVLRESKPSTARGLTRITFDSGLTTDLAVSPDGKLVAYASDRDGSGRLHIWVQQLMPGGQAIQLTRGDDEEHQPDFSPDGSKLVFRSERDGGGIYVIPAIGGNASLIAKEGRDPRFSPDGQWIAYWVGALMSPPFTANAGTVYRVPSNGGAAEPVRCNLREAGTPVWSPDGMHLLVFGYKIEPGPSLGSDWWVVPVRGGTAEPTGAFASLEKGGFSVRWPDNPRVASWSGDQLLFSARVGDSVNLWKIDMGGSDWRVTGVPERLTSGTEMDAYPSLTADGRLVFASLTNSLHVWTLPMETDRETVTGPVRRITETIGPHQFGSLSADGKLLTYSSIRYGHAQIQIKDLQSGREWPLTNSAATERRPLLSPDGSLVEFFGGEPPGRGFVAPVRGGAPSEFCSDCASGYDVSSDNTVVLYRRQHTIRAFNLRSRQDTPLLESVNYGFAQSKFSPDSHWVTFEAAHSGRSWLFIAALRNLMTAAPESEWIPVAAGGDWADKPRWAPDGNSIYFISNRDGYLCLWAQRLAADTKKSMGAPVSIAHFHGSRLSMRNVGLGALETSVARDKIAFNLGDLTGNIWVASAPR
jgi:Tol biopolymer transport system component/DNA-binding winged helix-turn-helix (wHTH) protein